MYSKEELKNKVFHGHILSELTKFPNDCLDAIVTSPPYYSQRFYGKELNTIWDGNNECKHDWLYYTECDELIDDEGVAGGKRETEEHCLGQKQAYCTKCGAWYGQLGQEATPTEYIRHLTTIFSECRRALKPTGLFFLNIGDTYAGSCSGHGIKIPNPKSIQSPLKGYSSASVMKPPAATCVGTEP